MSYIDQSSKVSVVIPFYSNVYWLDKALESVYLQTYKNIEVIVINDGSEECTKSLQEKYTKNIFFLKQVNQGAAAARNKGVELSLGKYIAFLDSDDLWLPNKLFKQIKYMENNNSTWSHSNYIQFSEYNQKKTSVKCNLDGNILPLALIWNPIATSCVVIKSEILRENLSLRFEESFSVGEDSHLWILLGEHYKLCHVNEDLVKVRLHGKNAAFQSSLQLQSQAALFERVKNYERYFKSKFLYFYTKKIFFYSNFFYGWVCELKDKYQIRQSTFESICKILYVFPYINSKILKILLKVSYVQK